MIHPDRKTKRVEMSVEERQSDEVINLIRKLRWIGLETEANELQGVLEGLPSPHRGSLVTGPHNTD